MDRNCERYFIILTGRLTINMVYKKTVSKFSKIVQLINIYDHGKSYIMQITILNFRAFSREKRNHTQSLSDNISKQNKLLTSTTTDSERPSFYECFYEYSWSFLLENERVFSTVLRTGSLLITTLAHEKFAITRFELDSTTRLRRCKMKMIYSFCIICRQISHLTLV